MTLCRRALREARAQLLEASDRLVGIADVEDLVVPDAIAVGHHDANEDVLERAAAVGHRPEVPYHLHTTVAAPGENPQRLAAQVGRESALPWAVIFPGEAVPRHPSQIYEAMLEGPVLTGVLWLQNVLSGAWALDWQIAQA